MIVSCWLVPGGLGCVQCGSEGLDSDSRKMNRGGEGGRRGVMSVTSAEDTRKKRELATISIRKQKREEAFLKRRHIVSSSAPAASPAGQTGGAGNMPSVAAEGSASAADPRASAIASLLNLFKSVSTPEELSMATAALVCFRCILP